MESRRYQLNTQDLIAVGKAVLYSAISAGIGALITLLPQVDVPAQYAVLIPIINAALVALKKLFTGVDGTLGVAKE